MSPRGLILRVEFIGKSHLWGGRYARQECFPVEAAERRRVIKDDVYKILKLSPHSLPRRKERGTYLQHSQSVLS